MKKIPSIFVVGLVIAVAAFWGWRKITAPGIDQTKEIPPMVISSPPVALPTPSGIDDSEQNNQNSDIPAPPASNSNFQPPLDRATERVSKKPFGIFITPQNSSVAPEKFRGYHVGTDLEIFPTELNADVLVKTVCSGKLLLKKYATGYGGVAVQACVLDNQPITVVYGHLKLASITTRVGDDLKVGDMLGVLGAAYSQETNGERKHLHLGFHKGTAINILGYVQNKNELAGWLDPCLQVCQ